MAWYEKRWWKQMWKEKSKVKADVPKDIEAISEFLEDVKRDISELQKILPEYYELVKESHVAKDKHVSKVNCESQSKLLDDLLEKYEYFQTDTDINGLRLKSIAKEFLKHAKKHGHDDIVHSKKENHRWMFGW
jgi:hypothetical protein